MENPRGLGELTLLNGDIQLGFYINGKRQDGQGVINFYKNRNKPSGEFKNNQNKGNRICLLKILKKRDAGEIQHLFLIYLLQELVLKGKGKHVFFAFIQVFFYTLVEFEEAGPSRDHVSHDQVRLEVEEVVSLAF